MQKKNPTNPTTSLDKQENKQQASFKGRIRRNQIIEPKRPKTGDETVLVRDEGTSPLWGLRLLFAISTAYPKARPSVFLHRYPALKNFILV